MICRDAITILDGATGSELDRRGVNTSLPLWSALALIEAPQALAEIHADYLSAGADAITTNTFRTHCRSLAKAGLESRADEMTRQAVQIARETRDRINPEALVFGSVSPLEDCYEPALAPGFDTCRLEHRRMIATLVEAGVDVVLIETMSSAAEARAAAIEADAAAPGRWILSCCCQMGDSLQLLSGESMSELLEQLDDELPRGLESAQAIGVNCGAAPTVEKQIAELRESLPACVGVIAYANVGRPDPVRGWIATDAVDPRRYADYAFRWAQAGATIVGGCCGTTPATIAAVRSRLRRGSSKRVS